MSIHFTLTDPYLSESIEISSQFIMIKMLMSMLAHKLRVPDSSLILINPQTNRPYAHHQYIKKGTSVLVTRKSQGSTQNWKIVDPEMLECMGNVAKFFIIKSSNQQNIQKAKDISLWATTYANQERFRNSFLTSQCTFLIFTTNRSHELKGLAKMESEPSKFPDKNVWSGVSNIRLGGNFKIRWIRKKPITLMQVEREIGFNIKEEIIRIGDGGEIDQEYGKKLCSLFEVPSEPYYSPPVENPKPVQQPKEKFMNISDILGNQASNKPAIHNFFISPGQLILNSSISSFQIHRPPFPQPQEPTKDQQLNLKNLKKKRQSPSIQSNSSSSSSSDSSSSSSSSDKTKKIRKQKKKKNKKDRKSKKQHKSSKHKSKKSSKKTKKQKKSKRKRSH